jgi:tripartite-type tricarboxylate transporter receptor subunit TctC
MNPARSFFLVATVAVSLPVSYAHAQAYPQRPVRIVVNVTAGGGVDALARIAAQHYTQVWGQPFVVDNRVGAGGSIGVELVTKAAPDGYTLLVTSSGVVTNAALRPQSYDPVRDLQPISRLTSNPYIVILTPSLPVANIKELIALARTKSGGISYASAGIGSIVHMGAELLSVMAGVPMTHIPYKGVADAYPAVAAGQADWMIGSPISALPLIRAGRLKAIAVTSKVRAKALPDVPTVAESGIPGYDVVAWFGMLAPAHMPPAIVNLLSIEARKSLQTPEVARRMEIEGTDVVGNSPPEFAKEVKIEYDKWLSLVKKTGMKF